MKEKISAGKNIEAYCTKCKLNLDHTVMAMEGEAIARVRCKTCGGAHKFREPADVKKVTKTRTKKAAGAKATAELVWEAGIAEAKGKEHSYAMTAKYRVGDIVNHQIFGKGIVMKLYTNKCDMLFKDKERLMASANEYKRA